MLRILALGALLALTLPTAAAEPIASVAVGPDGLVDPDRAPYYLWATVDEPTMTEPGEGSDCNAGSPRPHPVATANSLVEPVLAWDPAANFSGSTWFPGCVPLLLSAECILETSAPVCPASAHAYAAYDVASGRYHVEVAVLALPVAVPIPAKPAVEMQLAGTSGLALVADCEACPPPP